MGKPGVPAYGDRFSLVQLRYQPGRLAPRKYALKADASWYIRSDWKGKLWWIFRRGIRIAGPFRTLHAAMQQAFSHCCAAALGTRANWTGPDAPDAFFCRQCGRTCQRVLV